MPARKLTASAKYIDKMRKQVEVTAVVEGISSGAGNNHGHPESSPAQAPRMYFNLLQRRIDRDDELLSSEIIFDKPQIPEPKCGSALCKLDRRVPHERRRVSWLGLVGARRGS
jgi:hypothetical protein